MHIQQLLERFKSPIINNYEQVTLIGPTKKITVMAKIDTGANQTSIDVRLAEQLDLLTPANIIKYGRFFSGLGREERPIVRCSLTIGGITRKTQVSVSNRSHMRHPVIVGRQDIQGFLVRPAPEETP